MLHHACASPCVCDHASLCACPFLAQANSRIDVPKTLNPVDLRIYCAELENSAWAEGVSAAMGAKAKNSSQLNRRGGTHQTGDSWKPLIWAAKENQVMVATQLLDHGHNVNEQEDMKDKTTSGYSPVHWAAHKGYEQMLNLLLSRGALVNVKDKHGKSLPVETVVTPTNRSGTVARTAVCPSHGHGHGLWPCKHRYVARPSHVMLSVRTSLLRQLAEEARLDQRLQQPRHHP